MKQQIIRLVLLYFRFFARLQLKKIHPVVIGVAGSSGKSSLVSLLGAVLSTRHTVKTSGGKNSETGIPLSLLNISMQSYSALDWIRALVLVPLRVLFDWEKYDVYIAEMGIDSPVEPKNMTYLLKIVSPQIAMVTNISLEHSVYFDPYVRASSEKERQEKIFALTAKEETQLLLTRTENNTAIVNIDDSAIEDTRKAMHAKTITISLYDKNADLFAKDIRVSLSQFMMTIVWKEKEYMLEIPQLLPEFYAYEFLFTLATAMSMDIPLSEAIKNLQTSFQLPPGRLSLFEGIRQTTIIDSSYNNATPEPILGILHMLRTIATPRRRKVAIIGDMRELGSQSKTEHEKVAKEITKSVDMAILIGPLMHNYAAPILKRANFSYFSFVRFTDAKATIEQEIKEKDIILVKSSQNTLFLERVVEMLLADKDDVAKLCRRGVFWDSKRAESL